MATEMGSSRLELNPRREACSLHRQRTEGPEARQAPLLFLWDTLTWDSFSSPVTRTQFLPFMTWIGKFSELHFGFTTLLEREGWGFTADLGQCSCKPPGWWQCRGRGGLWQRGALWDTNVRQGFPRIDPQPWVARHEQAISWPRLQFCSECPEDYPISKELEKLR